MKEHHIYVLKWNLVGDTAQVLVPEYMYLHLPGLK